MVVSLLARPLTFVRRSREYLQFRARVRKTSCSGGAGTASCSATTSVGRDALLRSVPCSQEQDRCLGRYMASAWAGRPGMHVPPPFGDVAWGYQGQRAAGLIPAVFQPHTADTRRAELVVARVPGPRECSPLAAALHST
jgi:hypothetical protein